MALSGKLCVVTGASRGIGRACAQTLASAGARIAVCASSSAPDLGGAFSRRCDVSDAAEVTRFFAEVERQLGSPDVVVLNAGILERGAVDEFTEKQWDRVLDVNLKGAFLCAKAAWPALRKTRGRIVAIGSIAGTLGTPHASAYNASKWGLTGFVKSLAEEGREQRIFCALVLPGSVDTAMLENTTFEPELEASDIAQVVRFLASDAPFAMTGSAVEVFG
jgi:3-oxoacyl-[acyl-carrier protein] reductase